jgi:hypothetical protein
VTQQVLAYLRDHSQLALEHFAGCWLHGSPHPQGDRMRGEILLARRIVELRLDTIREFYGLTP